MKSRRTFTFAARALLLASALFLGACNLFDSEESAPVGESGLTSPWVGKPLDSLTNASALEFRAGVLYVANAHATSPGVAAVDTATGLITAYYPEIVAPSAMAFTADGDLVVTETDYTQGSVSVIDLSTKRIRKSVIAFGSDPGIQAVDGKVYLIDHYTGSVTGFTGNTPGQKVALDVQAGAGSNPYTIAVSGGKAYITRYNSPSLLILNDVGAIGGGTRDSIDLSAYVSHHPVDSVAPAPRMAAITAQDGYLFVAVQRLNYDYKPLDTSVVVVINASTKAIVKTIPLAFRNPVSATVRDGMWYVSGLQNYYDLLGGVEKINLSTREYAGVVVTEATLGSDVSTYVSTRSTGGYAIVAGAWPVYKVKKI